MELLGQLLISKSCRPIAIEGAKSPVSIADSVSAFQDRTHPPTKTCTGICFEVESASTEASRACLLPCSVV